MIAARLDPAQAGQRGKVENGIVRRVNDAGRIVVGPAGQRDQGAHGGLRREGGQRVRHA
jgi:hypothetical protein